LSESDSLDKKFQKEVHAGITALILLAVLDKAEGPMYGYQIAKILGGEQNDSTVKQGVLYPALRSLEGSGLLSSLIEPSVSGPPRRYYQITDTGRDSLARWRQIWRKTRAYVDAVLQEQG
jgi:PadR family transcriptional regulator, regulatory protein PadR